VEPGPDEELILELLKLLEREEELCRKS